MSSLEGQFNMDAVKDTVKVLREKLNPLIQRKELLLSEEKLLVKQIMELFQTYKNKQEIDKLNKSELEILKVELKGLVEQRSSIKKELQFIKDSIKGYFSEKTEK